VTFERAMFQSLASVPVTFNEFGLWYFVFGLFVVLGFVMLGLILLAEPTPQYDLDSLEDVAEMPEETH
jgi:amino acid permease